MENIKLISGNIYDYKTGGFIKGTLVIENGVIVKVSPYDRVEDQYIFPGLVNAHIHIESTMLSPVEYARVAVKHGTVAAVCDPHEIANVLGIYGIDFMIENGNSIPFNFYFGAPSCVPATDFETSGFKLNSEVIKSLLKGDDIFFLGEMMNYPGVIYENKDVLEKVLAGKRYNKPIDGHAPGLAGADLKKYLSFGITTDHECSTVEEAKEKIALGCKIQIREGSAAKNFNALYPLIDEYPDEVMLCTDDSHPDDLLEGHLNKLFLMGREKGISLQNLVKAMAVNPVKHYNLPIGLLQENDPADFIVVRDLETFSIKSTYLKGQKVYDGKEATFPKSKNIFINNFSREPLSPDALNITSTLDKFPVIEVMDGELITKRIDISLKKENGFVQPDLQNDILKIVVASRYDNSTPGVGFVKNFGLKKGALASSIAHDSHNIVAVGTSDEEILGAINSIIENHGGIVAYSKEKKKHLKLEIAGLMTNDPAEKVAAKYKEVDKLAKEFGTTLHAPFMTLSFMSLLVIPEIKIGDKGLFDVTKFEFINL